MTATDEGRMMGDRPSPRMSESLPSKREATQVLAWLVPIPNTIPLMRLGGYRDGAYLVPDDLAGISAAFSPGVGNRKKFEDDLAAIGIRSHLMDPTSDEETLQTRLISGMQTFRRGRLAGSNADDGMTLQQWVELDADDGSELILQMDIEGGEYEVLSVTPRHVLQRFRIIVIELHGLAAARNQRRFMETMVPAMGRLMRDFDVIHAHPNNAGRFVRIGAFPHVVPSTLELTLLRRDRLACMHAYLGGVHESPHELDIDWNTPGRPPMFLPASWQGGTIAVDALERRRNTMIRWHRWQLNRLIRAGSGPTSRRAAANWSGSGVRRWLRRRARRRDQLDW